MERSVRMREGRGEKPGAEGSPRPWTKEIGGEEMQKDE